jgi:hypothetical protein
MPHSNDMEMQCNSHVIFFLGPMDLNIKLWKTLRTGNGYGMIGIDLT